MQADEHASQSLTTPTGFLAPHMFLPSLQDNSVVSVSESGMQAPSDEGYHSRFSYCEHRPLGGDAFCDVCLGCDPALATVSDTFVTDSDSPIR
jgi:hypothetical protein